MINLILLVTLILLSSCQSFSQNEWEILKVKNDKKSSHKGKMPSSINYLFDCLLTDPIWDMAFIAWINEEAIIDNSPFHVSDNEENDFGEKVFKELQKSYKFLDNDPRQKGLEIILNNLLNARPSNSSKLKYKVYIIDDTTINAFTAGGYIYFTTEMLNFLESVSEIAFVMGHEIGHNENKDIKRFLTRSKIAGDFADIALLIKNLTTLSWNQFNEIRCDEYAIMLCYYAGYDPYVSIRLWEKFQKKFKEKPNIILRFLNTHPYSAERIECSKNFLSKNKI